MNDIQISVTIPKEKVESFIDFFKKAVERFPTEEEITRYFSHLMNNSLSGVIQ